MEQISYFQEFLRKLIHLSSLWMVAAIILCADQYRMLLAVTFGTAWILNLTLEHAVACQVPYITPVYYFFFKRMLRKTPQPSDWVISGGPPVWGAAFLVTMLFPTQAAATALAVMLIADTCAALIGRKFGKHPVNGKSIEGCAAFVTGGIAGAWGVSLFFPPLSITAICLTLCGIIAAMLAELFEKQLRIDDNFSIPLLVGLSMAFVV
jgi:dolichol kinase